MDRERAEKKAGGSGRSRRLVAWLVLFAAAAILAVVGVPRLPWMAPEIEAATVLFYSDEHATFVPEQPLRVGDRVRVLPSHVDPTVAKHDTLHLLDGDQVVETWPIDLRGW